MLDPIFPHLTHLSALSHPVLTPILTHLAPPTPLLLIPSPARLTGKVGTEIHGFGFGAQMHVLTVALSYAQRTQRVVVMRYTDNWWYTDRKDCQSRSFSCYFQPLGACTEAEVMCGGGGGRGEGKRCSCVRVPVQIDRLWLLPMRCRV